MSRSPKNAFTLIELSIVLVIIGLIVGGVLVGQDLIEAAERRSVVSERQQFEISINLFKDKFRKLPGDMDNAYTFWGASCAASAALCNGDGDKKVEYTDDEDVMVWKHLVLGGVLEGSYTGSGRLIGVNMPASKVKSAGWWFVYLPGGHYSGKRGHMLELAGYGGTYPNDYAVTPLFAKAIDDSFDDGDAGSGKLWVVRGITYQADATKCVDKATSGSPPVSYLLGDTTKSCRLFFWYD